jgi:sigma-B regulation protein RsbU (phosphoserine phosphatase)
MINARTLEMQFARGGHPGPVILKRDGTLESLEVEGSLLGIFANETFPDASAVLELGDRAFIFSDGVEVSFSDPASADAKHWRQALQNRYQMPTEQLLDDLSTQIDAESGSLDPKDDLTVIVAETI